MHKVVCCSDTSVQCRLQRNGMHQLYVRTRQIQPWRLQGGYLSYLRRLMKAQMTMLIQFACTCFVRTIASTLLYLSFAN